ncbi:MAG: phosphatase PAP2 family protein [Deltaproteobacteria bacterium]|nr:phosphatase PAP2 family protein [Deltaproteobacteria bacterium]
MSLRIDSFFQSFHGEVLAGPAQFFSIVGDGLTLIGICIFLFLAGMIFRSEHVRKSGMHGFAAILAASFFVLLFKITFERPRPGFHDTDILVFLKNPFIFDFDGRFNSFPSGHTTVSFALAYALSKSYPRLSPIFYTLAAMVGLSRVYLGSHYPSDVAGAVLLGLGSVMFLFYQERKQWQDIPSGLFLALAMFISFFKLGSLLLFDVDEAVYSEATREMLGTGNYITPSYNYEPFYDKPILFYWLQAAAFKLFGIAEFSARFVSASFGVALAAMTFFFVKRLYGRTAGILAGVCLVLNLEFFVYTHAAILDMMLTFFITASLYSFYLGFHQNKEKGSHSANYWYLLSWAFAALAALTKGIIGVLFPAMIIFLYLLAARELREIKRLLSPRFVLVFLAIASPWYIAQLSMHGWDFFNAFVIKHHFKRYTGVVTGQSGPIYYYILVMIAGFFPWVAFLPHALYKCLKEKGLYLFWTIWFLAIFIFFSLAGTKEPSYILPVFPAAAIMAGLVIKSLIEGGMEKTWLAISCGFLIITSLLMAMLFFLFPAILSVYLPKEILTGITFPPKPFLWGIAATYLAIALLAIMILKRRHLFSIGGIAAATAVLLILIRVYVAPFVNIYLQKTLYQYSTYARKNLSSEGVLATYEINQPSIAFYSRRGILKLEGEKGVKELAEIKKSKNILVITNKKYMQEVEQKAGLALVDTDGRFALFSNKQVVYDAR